MPKKSGKSSWGGRSGGRKSANSDDKHFFGHDDRTSHDMPSKGGKANGGRDTRPRVSFKNGPVPMMFDSKTIGRVSTADRRRFGGINFTAMKRYLDDDIAMSGGASSHEGQGLVRRGRGTGRGRNSPLSHRGGIRSRNYESKRSPACSTVWHSGTKSSPAYRITIPLGSKHEKEFIINALLGAIAPDIFVPIMYRTNDNKEAVFYVDDQKIAQKLQNCHWKIPLADGFKMQIHVEPGFPQYNVDQPMKEKMKQAMAKRYVQETNALDLSRFHLDPDLVDDYYCALTRPAIFIAAIDIIATVIPNLKALNLDNNNLFNLDKLHLLAKKLSSLKILYIGDNKIKDMQQINSLKGLRLDELRLAGNPLCEKYKERQEQYVSDVRNKFPELVRLDGTDLPAAIRFDLADDRISLPPTQRLFTPNPKAQEIASEFLQQYFRIYDSGNRQPLLDAYHEQASFSMTVGVTYNSNKFNSYVSDNRNLCKVIDATRRRKLLKQGRLPVVSYISELPKTQHDLTSFTMDIGLVTDGMMMITVSGLFKELETRDSVVRYFSRTFIIVPEGSGYCISNEMLQIRKATERQEKQAFQATRDPAETQTSVATSSSSSTVVAPVNPVAGTSAAATPIPDEVRTQMTLALCERTNMNLQWSLKCLEEVKWDFMTALAAFHEINSRGQIPPDAFTK